MSGYVAPQIGNYFFDRLPVYTRSRLHATLTLEHAERRRRFAETGRAIERVVFPIDAVVSTVTTLDDGAGVETIMTGREGFIGISILAGDDRSFNDSMVQVPGRVAHLAAATFAAVAAADAELRARCMRYALATFAIVAQFGACNRLHDVEERCARWILMCHDRVDGDELALTHEDVATMLGVRRPAVTLAIGRLERSGLIGHRRGTIVVLDRARLHAAACACYDVVGAEATRLLGFESRKSAAPDG